MVSKINTYIEILKTLPQWEAYLLAESGLPGPRGNLELAAAVAEVGDETRFMHLIGAYQPDEVGTANEYLPFCGLVGLGKLLAEGNRKVLPLLRCFANDDRWRLREASAIALQSWGKKDMDGLLDEMAFWSKGTLLEQRAAAAAMCEPVLLIQPAQVERVLGFLDNMTEELTHCAARKSEEFRVLRKGLAYCWSVAAVALPEAGKAFMEKWMATSDPDVSWIMKENLKKNRLVRMDPDWVGRWSERLK
jgi:hypothetical protein